ncbi:hypothetical protein EOD10_04310 [Mesorhizobium sp. M7A.T.Ca.TU.009.01.3.2]|nr:hypothetical protein EOD10_04310 [Mesorhizobium sp. M7A.T.Ca.TU.009.01.3.2]RUV12289.1 hypothetical protein EOD00_07455 [Mesorhizobium sp. M7A.T.Ca.TU.009.01.3.1]
MTFLPDGAIGEGRNENEYRWSSKAIYWCLSTRLYRKIVPQMVLWLPEEEPAQLKVEFEG